MKQNSTFTETSNGIPAAVQDDFCKQHTGMMVLLQNGEEPFAFNLSSLQLYIVFRSLVKENQENSFIMYSDEYLMMSRDWRFPLHHKLCSVSEEVQMLEQVLEQENLSGVVLVLDPWKDNQQEIYLSLLQTAVAFARLGITIENNVYQAPNDRILSAIYGQDWNPEFYKSASEVNPEVQPCPGTRQKIFVLSITHEGKETITAFKSKETACRLLEESFFNALLSNEQLEDRWDKLERDFMNTKANGDPYYQFLGKAGYEKGWIGLIDGPCSENLQEDSYFVYVKDSPFFKEYKVSTYCVIYADTYELAKKQGFDYYLAQNIKYAGNPDNKAKILESDDSHFIMEWTDKVSGKTHYCEGRIAPCED